MNKKQCGYQVKLSRIARESCHESSAVRKRIAVTTVATSLWKGTEVDLELWQIEAPSLSPLSRLQSIFLQMASTNLSLVCKWLHVVRGPLQHGSAYFSKIHTSWSKQKTIAEMGSRLPRSCIGKCPTCECKMWVHACNTFTHVARQFTCRKLSMGR